jgi:hypothetical protein
MRRVRFLHRRPVLLALGVVSACAAVTAATAPAYARPAAPARAAHQQASPSPYAPASGHRVSGTVFGAAARSGNSAAIAGFLKVHREMLADSRGVRPNTQLHAWWGSFPDTNSGTGVMATQSVSSTLRLSHAADILYAPTMTGADNDCIEVVTVHTTKTPQVWAWDWCNLIAPGAKVNVNATFLGKYTTTVNGRTAYTTKEVRTNASTNSWTAYLYDYKTKAWDTLFTSAGTDQSGLSYGWDMFEFYSDTNPATGNTYVCGDLQNASTRIESSSLEIYSGGTWNLATAKTTKWNPSAHPNPSGYLCPGMQFNIVKNNSDWLVDVAS